MYTLREKKLIKHLESRMKALFIERPSPGHNYDHADRVRRNAVILAKAEKAAIFLSELCALVHDIGRAFEKDYPGKTHHELSYNVFRVWLQEDIELQALTKHERLVILYSIRYHWNGAANKYKEAIILRDADKLDLFGKIGLQRHIDCSRDDMHLTHLLRLVYDCYYWLQTKTAKKIVDDNNLLLPITRYQMKLLKRNIEQITL